MPYLQNAFIIELIEVGRQTSRLDCLSEIQRMFEFDQCDVICEITVFWMNEKFLDLGVLFSIINNPQVIRSVTNMKITGTFQISKTGKEGS